MGIYPPQVNQKQKAPQGTIHGLQVFLTYVSDILQVTKYPKVNLGS